jgi:hypothetical protein
VLSYPEKFRFGDLVVLESNTALEQHSTSNKVIRNFVKNTFILNSEEIYKKYILGILESVVGRSFSEDRDNHSINEIMLNLRSLTKIVVIRTLIG